MALTREDLQAISDIVQTQMGRLETRMGRLETRMEGMETRMEGMETRMESMETRMESMETRVGNIEEKILPQMQRDIRKNQIILENDVLPRLQTIENCYTTTYRRYVNGSEQIETMQMDINVLKDVVAEHSEQLRKIS